MDYTIKAYIEKNINDLTANTNVYNYAYVNGILGALFITKVLPFKEYDEYYNRVRTIYETPKPKEEP